MNLERINTILEINTADITFQNLRWKCGSGVDTSTGKGAYKKVSYRHGVMTELGDIELKLWTQLMEQLIEESGEQWLLDALIRWEKEHNYTNATSSELRVSALELHSCRIFDNAKWVHYIPFNRRFRPEVLEQAHIVTIISKCCGIPGEITQEQIDSSWDGNVACPHCGRSSPYTIIKNKK